MPHDTFYRRATRKCLVKATASVHRIAANACKVSDVGCNANWDLNAV